MHSFIDNCCKVRVTFYLSQITYYNHHTGCGKSPWAKIKSKLTRSLNDYS